MGIGLVCERNNDSSVSFCFTELKRNIMLIQFPSFHFLQVQILEFWGYRKKFQSSMHVANWPAGSVCSFSGCYEYKGDYEVYRIGSVNCTLQEQGMFSTSHSPVV